MNTPSLPQRKLSQDRIFANLLAGDRVPVLRTAQDEADAAKRNGTASLSTLAAAVADNLPGGLPGPNESKSLLKEFRFYRKADRDADGYGGACFETDLDWGSCCGNTVAIIDFYRESDTEPFRNQRLVCVYDSNPTDPTHKAWVDGSFTGLRNPSKFVPVESAESQLANVPVFDSTKTNYPAGTVVQYTIGGQVYLYKVLVAGGPYPAPTASDGSGTADLQAIGKPTGNAASGNTRDLLDLTTDFMQAVMGLAYTDCDADPAASPAGSFPGQQFDAIYNGNNCHFYCTRGTYDPAAPAGTTGVGPAWHYFIKLG